MSRDLASIGNARLRELLEQLKAEDYADAEAGLAAALAGEALLEEGDGEWERGLLEVEQARMQSICGHHEESLALAERSLERFRKVGDVRKQISALNIVALSHDFLGSIGDSFRYGKAALELAQEKGVGEAVGVLANNLGLHLSYVGENEWALHFYEQGLAAAKEHGNRQQLENLYNNLAILYGDLGDLKAAFDFLQKAEERLREGGDTGKMGSHLVTRANLLMKEWHWEEALAELDEGAALLEKAGAYPHKRAHALELKSKILSEQGDGAGARRCLLAAKAIYEEYEIPRGLLNVKLELARLSDFPMEERMAWALEARQMAEALEQKPNLVEAHKVLRDLYRAQGAYAEALESLEKAVLLESHVRSEKVERHGNLLRVLHEVEAAREAGSEERERAQRLAGEMRLVEQERAEAERLHERKTEIFRLAAHDLKNMSGGIVSLSELALEGLQRGGECERKELEELVQPLAQEARDLHDTITHVLDANLLERGMMRIRKETVDVVALLKRVVASYERRAREKGQRLQFRGEGPLYVWADAVRWRQIAENLLSNAIKYTKQGETVEVECVGVGGKVRVDFLDRGPGLRVEEMEQIGQPMTRLSAVPTGGESSHGLGLYIVKQLLEQLEGRMEVGKRTGGGSFFRVEFPLQKTQEAVGKVG